MPLELRPATPTDVPAIVHVWDVAFKGSSALDSVFFPRTDPVRDWWRTVYEEDFADPSARFLKVVDTDKNDAIAAYGKWYVPIPLPKSPSSSSATGAGSNSSQASSNMTVGGAGPEEIAQAEWPDDYPARLCAEIFGAFAEARRKIYGNPLRPHYYLERIGVVPEYRGTEAGRQIIEWGLQKADAQGLEAYLEAHQGVVKLYEKFGWKEVGSYENAEIGHLESFMVRPARTD